MAREHFVSKSNSKLRITGKTIELNDVVWSIQNLVAIAISRKTIHNTDAEPVFNLSVPKFEFPISLAVIVFIGVIFSYFYNKYLFFVIVIFYVLGVIFTHRKLKKKFENTLQDWQLQKDGFNVQLKTWIDRKENPPILFGLVLETSASSRSIIYSYAQTQIRNAHSEIKSAMEATKNGETYISIDTVNVGGDSAINNFDSEIFNQEIRE
jgi:hypothetical protein